MFLHPVIQNYFASIPPADFNDKFSEMAMVVKIVLYYEEDSFKQLLYLKNLEENGIP